MVLLEDLWTLVAAIIHAPSNRLPEAITAAVSRSVRETISPVSFTSPTQETKKWNMWMLDVHLETLQGLLSVHTSPECAIALSTRQYVCGRQSQSAMLY